MTTNSLTFLLLRNRNWATSVWNQANFLTAQCNKILRGNHVYVRRRKWQPTPVPLPGKFYGWKSLVGYSPWGHKESDITERHLFLSFYCSFWRRKLQPTPVFLPGGSHGWRGLVGCSLRGCKELDMTKQLTHTCICICAQFLREWQIRVPWNIHFMTAPFRTAAILSIDKIPCRGYVSALAGSTIKVSKH